MSAHTILDNGGAIGLTFDSAAQIFRVTNVAEPLAPDAISLREIPYEPQRPVPIGRAVPITLGAWADAGRGAGETVLDRVAA